MAAKPKPAPSPARALTVADAHALADRVEREPQRPGSEVTTLVRAMRLALAGRNYSDKLEQEEN